LSYDHHLFPSRNGLEKTFISMLWAYLSTPIFVIKVRSSAADHWPGTFGLCSHP